MFNQLVSTEFLPNGVRFKLHPHGREEIEDQELNIFDVLEYQVANGWEWIDPEQIGALTDAPIISDSVEFDDSGEIASIDRVFWYPDYQVKDPVEELLKHGFVDFLHATA